MKTFSILAILTNTCVLCLNRYPAPSESELKTIVYINRLFAIYFTIEMVLKIIGFGFKDYIRNRINLFDASVTILTWVEIGIYKTQSTSSGIRIWKMFNIL